jgi:ankyrin repeat protein
MGTRACTTHAPSLASPPPPLTCARLPARLAGQNGATSLMWASANGHVDAMRVLIEKGALIEAADKVRIHSHATTHSRSQTLIHTRMHTLACEWSNLV